MPTIDETIVALRLAGIDDATIADAMLRLTTTVTDIVGDALQDKASEAIDNTTATSNDKDIDVNTTTNIDTDRAYSPVSIRKEIARRKLDKSDPKRISQRKTVGLLVNLSGKELSAMLAGETVTFSAKSGNVYRMSALTECSPMPHKASAPVAPAPERTPERTPRKALPLAEKVAQLVANNPGIWTVREVAEELNITVKQAQTQLTNLTSARNAGKRAGRIVRKGNGCYASAS